MNAETTMHSVSGMLLAVLLAAVPVSAVAAEDELPEAERAAHAEYNSQLEREIERLTRELAAAPGSVGLYSRRGDALFFRGRFAEAVADYDRMVELDPSLSASHWRRGIALYYADEPKRAAEQFGLYHTFDQVDRENGIWRFLSQVRFQGLDAARNDLLPYDKEDRPPLPLVYRMFAGEITPDDVARTIAGSDAPQTEKQKQAFYADLYIGLYADVIGEQETARRALTRAVLNPWGKSARGGPGYMWQVARLHRERLLQAERAAD